MKIVHFGTIFYIGRQTFSEPQAVLRGDENKVKKHSVTENTFSEANVSEVNGSTSTCEDEQQPAIKVRYLF